METNTYLHFKQFHISVLEIFTPKESVFSYSTFKYILICVALGDYIAILGDYIAIIFMSRQNREKS